MLLLPFILIGVIYVAGNISCSKRKQDRYTRRQHEYKAIARRVDSSLYRDRVKYGKKYKVDATCLVSTYVFIVDGVEYTVEHDSYSGYQPPDEAEVYWPDGHPELAELNITGGYRMTTGQKIYVFGTLGLLVFLLLFFILGSLR